jgi:ABC-2 type transport system ATP-binding protein
MSVDGSPTLVIEARQLRQRFGQTTALDNIDWHIGPRRIVGIVGPNGAGKSSVLQAVLGLAPFSGHLRVLGLDPWRQRDTLMPDVAYIADVAVLPRWITVKRLLDYVSAVHPRFSRAKAEGLLTRTAISSASKVKDLSKGLVTQLHLCLVMAIEARLLVLDEPTLGLDLLFQKQFYDSLLEDYLADDRSILIATHNVDEIEHVVTDVLFLDRGRVALFASMDEIAARFCEVRVHPSHVDSARALQPVHERDVLGQHVMVFDGIDIAQLQVLGDVRRPSLADLFTATLGRGHAR